MGAGGDVQPLVPTAPRYDGCGGGVPPEGVMATVSFEIPDEYLCTFEQTPEEFARAVRLAAAMFWFQREERSTGRAAEVAGMNRAEFLQALANAKIQNVAVDPDELRREFSRG